MDEEKMQKIVGLVEILRMKLGLEGALTEVAELIDAIETGRDLSEMQKFMIASLEDPLTTDIQEAEEETVEPVTNKLNTLYREPGIMI